MMKSIAAIAVIVLTTTACSDSKGRYVDLSTGKAIEVREDDKTGFMVNKETGEPLYIYVDTRKKDTIYAKTGQVINGHVVKSTDNSYVFDEDEKLKVDNEETKYKDNDYKMEVEKDGDIKIKTGDSKVKIDGETGERKEKKD